MSVLHTIISETVGMFVDDGMLALLCVVLIAGVTAAVLLVGLPPLAGGVALLAGCIAILARGVLRGARRP